MRYSTESEAGRARAQALMTPEPKPVEPATTRGQKVDPSVTLGPLEGEPKGSVPIKSPAYTGKF